MATNLASPGVTIIEQDNSQFAPTLNSSVVGLVGFASKGPPNKAVLITSPQNLIDTFGRPDEDLEGQALEGAIEILETTDQLYFVRSITSASSTDASVSIQMGTCPGVVFSGTTHGVTTDLYLSVQVLDNDGVAQYNTPKKFDIIASTVGSAFGVSDAFIQVVGNGSLQTVKVGADGLSASGVLFGSFAGSGARLQVSSYTDSARTAGVSSMRGIGIDGNASGTTASTIDIPGITYKSTDASALVYFVESIYPGAGYNAGTGSDGSTSGNSIKVTNLGGIVNRFDVNDTGALLETFYPSLQASGNFIEDVINTGEVDLKSIVIKGNLTDDQVDFTAVAITNFRDPLSTLGVLTTVGNIGNGEEDCAGSRYVKLIAGTYDLAGGTNGIGTTDENVTALIGDNTVTPKTGMQALDDDTLNISLAAVPGITDQDVQNNLITLAETTQNFLAVVSPPFGIGTVQNAIDWSNGFATGRTTAINNSYAAIYWPWVQIFSTFDQKDRWYDPAIFAIRSMTFTDSVAEAWFAPAGDARGRLTKATAVEVILNQGDRNSLYGGGNVVNPIVSFPQRGIIIWGQRTTQRAATSLDRVNVRRLMIFLKKSFMFAAGPVVFEPNDIFTWSLVKTILDPLLEDIRRRRGVIDYKVICDETTNTPTRIDKNELWCTVKIKPTKTAEIIILELNLTSQSASL